MPAKTNTELNADMEAAKKASDKVMTSEQEQLKKLKEENARMAAQLKAAGVASEAKTPGLVKTKDIKKRRDPYEKVPLELYFGKDYKEPLHVKVGDFDQKIPRGVCVMVPYYVWKHVKEMEAQDANTIRIVEGLVEEYERVKLALGITA